MESQTKRVEQRGRGVRWEAVETASLQDVRIFLMPSDMAGIYNSSGGLTRPAVAHTVPKLKLCSIEGTLGKDKTLQVSKNIISFS